MASYEEAEAFVERQERREAAKLQQRGESNVHYVERRINESSAELKLGISITVEPCEAFTSTMDGDSQIIPSGYLIHMVQQGMLGFEKELAPRDVMTRMRSAFSAYNSWPQHRGSIEGNKKINTTGITHTAKGVWIGSQTLEDMAKAPRPHSPSRGEAAEALEIIANRLAPEKQRKR